VKHARAKTLKWRLIATIGAAGLAALAMATVANATTKSLWLWLAGVHHRRRDTGTEAFFRIDCVTVAKTDCKDGGWMNYGSAFNIQGTCLSVAT
jgi:hypothetical protein